MLFVVSNTPFVDVRLAPYPSGLDPYRKAALGDASPLCGTDQVPAVTAPDGTNCVETADIMKFVGQRVGLAPTDAGADAKAMEVTLLMQDVMNKVFYALLRPMVVKEILGCAAYLMNGSESSYLAGPAQKLTEALQKLEGVLETSGGPYICGKQMSYADVSVFAILNEVLAYKCFDKVALLASYPKLSVLLTDLGSRLNAWIAYRVREHQVGIQSTIGIFAAMYTPFPWAKKSGRGATEAVDVNPSQLT